MNRIIGGLLCKNEEHRWLKQYLEQMKVLCDHIVVVDDNSIDNTVDMCSKYTKYIYSGNNLSFEINESYLRERLFNLCVEKCNENDWIIILDADELLNDALTLRNILLSCDKSVKSLSMKLYDMWNDFQYRHDEYWTAHEKFWLMCVRCVDKNYAGYIYKKWSRNQLHCGRFPLDVYGQICYSTDGAYIKHMGWSTEQDRKNKYDRYMKLDGKGEFGILEQYESILDPNPKLVTL